MIFRKTERSLLFINTRPFLRMNVLSLLYSDAVTTNALHAENNVEITVALNTCIRKFADAFAEISCCLLYMTNNIRDASIHHVLNEGLNLLTRKTENRLFFINVLMEATVTIYFDKLLINVRKSFFQLLRRMSANSF